MGSGGNLEGTAPVHYPDTSFLHRALHTAHVLGRPRADIREVAVEGECRLNKLGVGQLHARQEVPEPLLDWLEQPGRRHVRAPRQPCAGLLPPSYEPSIPCESP